MVPVISPSDFGGLVFFKSQRTKWINSVVWATALLLTLAGWTDLSLAHAKKSNRTTQQTVTKPMLKTPAVSLETSANTQNFLPAQPPKKKFSGNVNIARGRSMVDFQDGSRAEVLEIATKLKYGFGPNYKSSLLVVYGQNPKTQEGDWVDPQFTLSRKEFQMGTKLTFSPGMLLDFPASKDARLRQELQGAAGISGRLGFQPNVLIKGLDLYFSTTLVRKFHRYQTATDGSVNTAYSSLQKLATTYTMGKFSLTGIFYHSNSLTYENGLKESFQHIEEIGYDFTSNINLALGHTNSGPALKANGQDNNILITNDNSSVVYVSTTISF